MTTLHVMSEVKGGLKRHFTLKARKIFKSNRMTIDDVESNSSTMVVLWLPSCCGSSKSIWSQEHRKVVNDLMVKTNMCIQESHIIQFIITVFTGAGSS